jgi:hypothetical protein
MDVIRRCARLSRCCIGMLAVLLSACAHDPAPRARCHGPWVWVTVPTTGLADSALKHRAARSKSANGHLELSVPGSDTPPAGGPP